MTRTLRPRSTARAALATVLLTVIAVVAGPAATAAPAAAARPPSTATPAAAPALGRLTVQLSGTFTDTTDPAARPPRTGVVVGTVASDPLGFVTETGSGGDDSFRFLVVCATGEGTSCATGTELRWTFGDGTSATSTVGEPNPGDPTPDPSGGTVGSALTMYHRYTTPGAHTVQVTVSDPAAPAAGSAAIRALAAPRFADVDAAYTTADGTGKPAHALSESVWAVAALGLLGPCRPYYSDHSFTRLRGHRPEDPGRGVFCPSPGGDLVTAAAGAQTHPPVNGAPRAGYTPDTWAAADARYTDTRDCFATAANCGLPVEVFAGAGTPSGSPLAACTDACLQVLANRNLITGSADPMLRYDPLNCADNTVAVYAQSGSDTVTLTRGVEAGCATRGTFLRAVLTAVDAAGTAALADGSAAVAVDASACPVGVAAPDAAGRDGIRRATALLSSAGAPVSPCAPDAALTKGEAYRILAALLPDAGSATTVDLADLDDRSLGRATAEPYPHRGAVRRVLAAGAPLVGSATCPVPAAGSSLLCFNPYEALTRGDAAQLLAYFVLGEHAEVAAVSAQLSSDATDVHIGEVAQLRLTLTAPAWLRPYPADWELSVGDGVPASAAEFGCATTQTTTVTAPTATVTCPVTIHGQPDGGLLPIRAVVNGVTYPPVTLTVTNTPPAVHTAPAPTLTEDGGPGTTTVTFSDAESTAVTTMQVAASATGPWAGAVTTDLVTVRVTGLDTLTGEGTLEVTPAPDANGPYAVYVRACDAGDACSDPEPVTGAVAGVNDAPVAFPLSNVLRSDNVAETTGDCVAAQTGPLTANTLRLRGDDPVDTGYAGYTAQISSYRVTAPADPFGDLHVCNDSGSWSPVLPGQTHTTVHPVVLLNPTPGRYGQSTAATSHRYTVVDAGAPTGGLESAPQTISVTNTRPGVAPVAVLDVDTTTGAAATSDFTFTGARSHDDGSPDGIVSYTFDFGDGSPATTQTSPSVRHRYLADGAYAVTLTVADVEGLTATTTVAVTVTANLLENPTVDDATTGWAPAEAGTVVSTTAVDPHGGGGAGTVARTGQSPGCRVSTSPPLAGGSVAGRRYAASVWVRAGADSAGDELTLEVTETGASGLVGALAAVATLGPAGVWVRVPLTYTAVGDGSTLAVTVGIADFAGAGCFDFDDAALTVDTP